MSGAGGWGLVGFVVGFAVGTCSAVFVERWPSGEAAGATRSGSRGRRGGPWRRPAVALASGVLAGAALAVLGPSAEGLIAMTLALALVPVVVIDIEERLIPDVVVLPTAGLVLAVAALAGPGRWWLPVASAAGATGFMLALCALSPEGMGMGDVKLAMLLGAALGPAVVPALVIAFVLGGISGAWLLARRGASARRIGMPFGPFLAAGAAGALVVERDVPHWLGAFAG